MLRSPALWDDEPAAAGPRFAGNIHPSADGLAVQRNYRDSSSVSGRTQNDNAGATRGLSSKSRRSGGRDLRYKCRVLGVFF